MICPLCAAGDLTGHDRAGSPALFFSDAAVARADFFHCPQCHLIFKSPDVHLDARAERQRYALHNNVSGDAGYARWLTPAVDAISASCPAGAEGLDYGCGPGPVLAELLTVCGFPTRVYDPYFAQDASVLDARYDFVTCTEVAEHFYQPGKEFTKLVSLLRPPHGKLVIMTGLHHGREAFKTWHYRIDPTHVCFYSRQTFEWIARRHGLRVEFAPAPASLASFKFP